MIFAGNVQDGLRSIDIMKTRGYKKDAEMERMFSEWSNKKICIYCRGEYGIDMYLRLTDNGIPVAYFGDKDTNKQGYVFEGLYCLSYEEFLNLDKEGTVIIVCIKNQDALVKEFQNKGFLYVYGRDKVLPFLNQEYSGRDLRVQDIALIQQWKNGIEQAVYNNELIKDVQDNGIKEMLRDYFGRMCQGVQSV